MKRPNPDTFPDGTKKSQRNAFTAYLTDPKSTFVGAAGFRPLPPQLTRPNTRFQEADKARIHTNL